jgi:hypothetical protein
MLSAQGNAHEKKNKPARVSILSFEDRTESNYYGYMSESLSDAIDFSMKKKFSYIRENAEEIKKTFFKKRHTLFDSDITAGNTKIINKAVKTKEKTDKQLQHDEVQLALARKVANTQNSDFVIYGYYSFNNETNKLVFTPLIYEVSTDTLIEFDEAQNVIDNTVFKATGNVADILVTNIHNMLEDTEKILAKKEKEEETLAKSDVKQNILSFNWASKKFSLTFSPGFLMNVSPLKGCGACELPVSMVSRIWVIPNLYIGLGLNAGGINSTGIPFVNGMPLWLAFDGLASLGYGLPVGKWLFSADVGGGYFVILDKTRGALLNPAFGARFNSEFLVSPVFSLGFSIMGHMYYDIPKPLIFGGMTLTLSYVM